MADQSKSFIDMATRIDRMDGEFAGAVVVVPPGDGKPIAFLYTDPDPSAAQFWTALKSRIEIAAAEAEANDGRIAAGYGLRR